MHVPVRLWFAVVSMAALGACGESKPANAPENAEASESASGGLGSGGSGSRGSGATASASKREGMNVQGELGEIDKAATTRKFDALGGRLAECVAKSHEKVPQVSGDVSFFLRVGEDGRAKYAYLEESTLGDREAEKCMLSVLGSADWPKPKGGEAEVRQSLRFDLDNGIRPPSEWPSDKISAALVKQNSAVEACKSGSSKFRVTAYVEPAGKEGKVQAAGVSVADKDAAAKADCVIEVVKGLRVPSPGSYVAKVSFSL